ncbi:hypothetical protein DCAR_0310847 [Daucus carota subsp. sativus]|uniref:Uncharacterized protein n=1 Tax=Daucus carota subsp. sativus TaxID=79200 RepID=A0A166A7Y5_DAUCS|nr:hypothetical protein DCAR_0310847 [Daucus carota subsp. sativus]
METTIATDLTRQINQKSEEDGFGGVMGMGRGMMSLVSQLNVSKLSYYLPSIDDGLLLMMIRKMNATVDDTSSDGYVACFDLHSSVVVPKLVFHFENADIELDNYMINDRRSGSGA